MSDFLKVAQVAKELDLDPRHVRRLASQGLIPSTVKTPGGHYRFINNRELQRWIGDYYFNKTKRRENSEFKEIVRTAKTPKMPPPDFQPPLGDLPETEKLKK